MRKKLLDGFISGPDASRWSRVINAVRPPSGRDWAALDRSGAHRAFPARRPGQVINKHGGGPGVIC